MTGVCRKGAKCFHGGYLLARLTRPLVELNLVSDVGSAAFVFKQLHSPIITHGLLQCFAFPLAYFPVLTTHIMTTSKIRRTVVIVVWPHLHGYPRRADL